jgi:outer membrane cobalamin receptor
MEEMVVRKTTRFIGVGALFFLSVLSARAQRVRGELRLEVHDPHGAAMSPAGELVSEANGFRKSFVAGPEGRYVAQDLPFGVYRLSLQADGFARWSDLVEIRSEVPVRVAVTLGVAPLTTEVQVNDSATLVDPNATGTLYSIGQQAIEEHEGGPPGRELLDMVATQPGWLYEANGVLHPRGSEYDVQFVVDGLPLTENRSPAFAPSFDAGEVESLRVVTAGFPAEYGRKLGGIVEVTPKKDVPAGWHGRLDAGGGSFSRLNGAAGISYALGANRFSVGGQGFHTDRYLDPPVLANYTNRGTAAGFSASYERDFSTSDRLRVSVVHGAARFLVPNELVQQQVGQRQDIQNTETSGQIHFQHTISPELFLSFSGSMRDSSAALTSNAQAKPVIVSQDRGYREGYVRADLAGHHGHHDWKTGADSIFSPVHESLQYAITDPTQFDPGTQLNFQFPYQRKWDIEPSIYLQDQMHIGMWNVSAGLRFDHYAFVVHESAWSPRIGVSRFVPALSLLLHVSYDRVFQTPAVENLLLASSPLLDAISPSVLRLPVRPGRGNFFEGGVTKAFLGKLRLDANIFRRDFRQYSDDDVLLDTGVSFPIAFAKARILGEEIRMELSQWGRFSGYLSYANQSGIGQGPITGGLFLGSGAANVLTDTSKFAVTQDQRNSLRARVHFQAPRRTWLAMGAQYGSGLPANIGDARVADLLSAFGQQILDRVDLARGRVRPNLSLDVAAGAEIYHRESRSAVLQIQAANLANRLNVINFASLFSGTALGEPRSVSLNLRLAF